MKKRQMMEVDPDFAKFVDELASDVAKNLGIKKRLISANYVTKKMIEKIKKNNINLGI